MKVTLFTTQYPRTVQTRQNNSAPKTKEVAFGSANLTPNDFRYKVALIKGLLENFNIKVTLDELSSIVAPDELRELLKKFKPVDYMTGKLQPEHLFDNVKTKTYRVNLHSHTNFSDGRMSVGDFLDQSAAYADEVAKANTKDDLPPYTTAITDHNVLDGVREAIVRIAQNPEKYKNMKFVPACEFMFYDIKGALEYPYFEAVSLGLNPFDKSFSYKYYDFYDKIKLIPKMKEYGGVVSYAHPLRHCQHNRFSPRLLDFLKRIGVNGMESEYQYLGFEPSKQTLEQIEHVKKVTKDLGWFPTGGTDTHATNIFHAKAEQMLYTDGFEWFPRNPEKTLRPEVPFSEGNPQNCLTRFVTSVTDVFRKKDNPADNDIFFDEWV